MGFLCIGCHDFGPDNSGKVTISTDKSTYDPLGTITFTVQNWSETTAYMWHCNFRLGYQIQKEDGGAWKSVGDRNMICLAIYLSGAEPIVAGHPYTDTLSLSSPGLYRIEMNVGWDREHLSESQIYSNTFRVESKPQP